MLAARREEELAALANEIEDQGGSASFVTTDVSVGQDVERMVAHTIETFGRLDYAVNNAGIEGQFAGVVELPEEEWDRVIDINLKGTFRLNTSAVTARCVPHRPRSCGLDRDSFRR